MILAIKKAADGEEDNKDDSSSEEEDSEDDDEDPETPIGAFTSNPLNGAAGGAQPRKKQSSRIKIVRQQSDALSNPLDDSD